MKKILRASVLIAFAVFIALSLGAARMAHVFSNRALLEWAGNDYGNAKQTCESLLDKVCTFRGHAPQNDDIAILTIHIL